MTDRALRVVIADDEPLAREGLRRALDLIAEPPTRVVAECENGEEVVRTLEQERIDVLLLDIQMPVLDGFAVLDRLEPEQMPRVGHLRHCLRRARRPRIRGPRARLLAQARACRPSACCVAQSAAPCARVGSTGPQAHPADTEPDDERGTTAPLHTAPRARSWADDGSTGRRDRVDRGGRLLRATAHRSCAPHAPRANARAGADDWIPPVSSAHTDPPSSGSIASARSGRSHATSTKSFWCQVSVRP